MKKIKSQQLTKEWNRAATRAAEEQRREPELGEQELKEACGVKIKSALKAGQISVAYMCQGDRENF
ncbi:MAG TPA: hypothetical protein VFD70_02160 [Anaerolineae bacterium]|nr:hypothetical protein [Anaerolineae bacterium]